MMDAVKFDLILTDYHLSATDRGTDLKVSDTPLILMSGGISDEEFSVISDTIDMFVPKPFSPSDILSAINALLDTEG
jgi:DNA-binding response OmpR family regulator